MKPTWLTDFLHILYPHFCVGCGNDAIDQHQPLCIQCENKLPKTHFFEMKSNPVLDIFTGRIKLENAASAYYNTHHSTLEKLIYPMKYQSGKSTAIYLGQLLGRAFQQSDWHSTIDALIPLPLWKGKQQKRGFNQAELLCIGMANVHKKEIITDAVIRKQATESQTKKTRTDRILNMEYVFELVQPERIAGKHILLIDDLVTTGATLEFCGNEILKAPGTKLSIATLAKSMH